MLVWQVILFKKQLSQYQRASDIAYGPFIVPRTTIIEGRIYLAFSNIGSGSAKNIHLHIYDPETDEDFQPFDMFAMRPSIDDDRLANVNVADHQVVVIEGSYENVIDELKTMHVIYHHQTRDAENLQEQGLVFYNRSTL